MSFLFTANIPKKEQERLEADYPEQKFLFHTNIGDDVLALEGVKVIVTFGGDLTEEIINKASQLEWIMVLSAGMERMPLKAIAERNILVTNVRGIHKVPMAEYVISMLLQVYRQEKFIMKNEMKQEWHKSVEMKEISNKKMLIVGTGSIGQEIARLGQAFHMETIGLSRSGKDVKYFDACYQIEELNEKLQEVDFVVSVLPSTRETQNVFQCEQFNMMKEEAVFVNVGRGDVLIEADLLKAIREKKIAHAVLDVFQEEPLPSNHPFWLEENITITPHLSATTSSYVPRALEMFEHNLKTYLNKEDDYINIIDVERGY